MEPNQTRKVKRHQSLFSVNLLLVFSIFIIPNQLLAKKVFFNFTNIGFEQGLDNPHVVTVLHDRQGFVWVGTQNGLFRYDGHGFKAYMHKPVDENSLAHNYVQSLFEDRTGGLWVGSGSGVLHQYHAQTDNFTRFPFDKAYPDTSMSNSAIMSISQGNIKTLWVATLGGGLSRFDLSKKQFTHQYRHDPDDNQSLGDDKLYSVLQDSQGMVWIGTRSQGLNVLNPETGVFKRYQHHPGEPNSLSNNKVWSLLEDSEGTLWVGTLYGGLNRFDRENESFDNYQHNPDDPNSLSKNQIQSIYQDRAGSLWIGVYRGGLNRFNPRSQNFTRYLHEPLNKKSLGSDRVTSITQDYTGNIWLSTFGGGLSFFNPDNERFGVNRHQPNSNNTLSEGSIRAIFKDKMGIVWVGSSDGLDRYDEANNNYTHYQHQPNNSQSLSDSSVQAIFEDKRGILWIGTTQGGLNRVNRKRSGIPINPVDYTFSHYKHQTKELGSLSDNNVNVIHEDCNHQLWIGTRSGLNRFNPEQDDFSSFFHMKDLLNSLSDDVIFSLFSDKQCRLWIGTQNGGLNLYQPRSKSESLYDKEKYAEISELSNGEFVRYQHNSKAPSSISNNAINSIAQDSKGILWLGTDGGLNSFAPESEIATHYRIKDGLSSDIVFQLVVDKKDNIWLGLSNGNTVVNQYSSDEEREISVTNYIGAEADCYINQGALFQAQDEQMLWGGAGQYCQFYPEQVVKDSIEPIIALTDFKLLNQSISVSTKDKPTSLTQAINELPDITLNYKENILSFEFSALHFTNAKLNKFKYKLEGFEEDWIETSSEIRTIQYTNLGPNNYTFKVKASNNEGVWNEQGRSIKLNILPAPWKTWWAYSLYGMLMLSLIGLFIRIQRNKVLFVRKINEQLEHKVVERTGELEKANETLKELSFTDQLTGLKNRRFLLNNLKGDIDLVLRNYYDHKLNNKKQMIKESDLIFFLIDLDHFKKVNDVYGHTAGDAVLIQIKSILEQVFRETDYIVRWGGEEFLVIARYSDRIRAPKLAERLRREVELHEFEIGQGKIIKKTCSIGYSCFPFLIGKPECMNWEQIIDIADHCMYAAKNSGRNAWIGLDNVDCDEDNIFVNVTEKTNRLIDLKKLKVTTSTSIIDNIKWS